VTGLAQVAFPGRANGEQVKVGGKVVGSKLIAQPVRDRHRQAGLERQTRSRRPTRSTSSRGRRPTPTTRAATFFGNHGPNQASTMFLTRDQLQAYLALEQPYDPA